MIFIILFVIAFIDVLIRKIPNKLNFIIFAMGSLSLLLGRMPPLADRMLGIFCIAVPMIAANNIKENSFGGGDVKLVAVLGWSFGTGFILNVSLIALVVAGVYGITIISFQRIQGILRDCLNFNLCNSQNQNKELGIPFAPFLLFGIFLEEIWNIQMLLFLV
ncbi:MAG: A24 family peptidase [Eubacteriales bacterium]|nr:A24 family peptidase [Eubacteriales bacterium]MDY3333264.1 A24 family peptidase [Gallibacter sp.]